MQKESTVLPILAFEQQMWICFQESFSYPEGKSMHSFTGFSYKYMVQLTHLSQRKQFLHQIFQSMMGYHNGNEDSGHIHYSYTLTVTGSDVRTVLKIFLS